MNQKSLWQCFHCQEKIAPRAAKCPHCGGTFDAYSRGFMSSNARAADKWAREKAGLPPKGCLGAFVGLIGVGMFLVATTTYVMAKDARPNVAGMMSGIPLKQFTPALPEELSKVSPQRQALDVTFFGNSSGTNINLDFVGKMNWRFQKPNYQHTVLATVDPSGIVTSIERMVSYEIGYKNPPLADGVINGLRQKYGAPEKIEKYQSGLQRFHWWIKTGEAKSAHVKSSQICPERAARLRNGLDWIEGVKSANGLQVFASSYGNIGADCGFIIRAEVSRSGSQLRAIKVLLIDVQQVHKTLRDTHFLLRDKSLEAEIKQKANSEAAPEL